MKITPQEAAKEALARQAARDSLLSFTEYTHPAWETGEHHALLGDWLDRLESRGRCPHCGDRVQQLAVHAPPRHSKTEMASRRFPAYYLGKHPGRQVICASHTELLASDIGADVRDIVDSEEYRRLFPELELRKDASAAGRWRTKQGGIYFAVGAGGSVPGRGAHLLVIDDPHGGRNKAESKRERDLVADWYFGDVIQRLMRPVTVLLIMTRWHEDDLAGRVMPPEKEWVQEDAEGRVFRAGKFHVIMMRAIENEGTTDERPLWPGKSEPEDESEILAGYPLEYLQDLRETLLKAGKLREWRAQYQQNPVPEGGTYCKRDWLKNRYSLDAGLLDKPEGRPSNLRIYSASDFAITTEQASDFTEHGVFGFSETGELYVLDWWGERETSAVWIESLLDIWARWKPATWFGETGMIRRAIEPILDKRAYERRIWTTKHWLPSIRDKAARGQPFRAWAQQGRIRFPKDCDWADEVIEQCVAFPLGRKDDKFDVMSLVCAALDEMQPATKPMTQLQWQRERRYKRKSESNVLPLWKIA